MSFIADPRDEIIAVLMSDYTLSVGLCDVVPFKEASLLPDTLIPIYEATHRAMNFLKLIITREIDITFQASTIFRSNNSRTKLMTAFSKLVATEYLKKTVRTLIQDISVNNPQVEVDSNIAGPNEDIQQNIENLNNICQTFFDTIVDSLPECPRPMRVICRHIFLEIQKKFGDDVAKSGLVGFFFLRFFIPSLIDKEILGDLGQAPESVTRCLTLVSKTLLGLVNGVEFKKESSMSPMNEFIFKNRSRLNEFLEHLIEIEETPEDAILLAQPQQGCNAEKLRQRKVALMDLFSRNTSQLITYLNSTCTDETELSQNLAKLEQLREYQGKAQENSRKEVTSSLGNHRRPTPIPAVLPSHRNSLDYKKKRASVIFTSLLSNMNHNISLVNLRSLSNPEKTQAPDDSDKQQHMRGALKDWYGSDWERAEQNIKKKEEKEEKLVRANTHTPPPVLPLSSLDPVSAPLVSPSSRSTTTSITSPHPLSSESEPDPQPPSTEAEPRPANVVVTTLNITAKDSSLDSSQFATVPASNVKVVSNTTAATGFVRVTAYNSNFSASLGSRRLIVHAERPASPLHRNIELSRKRHTSMQISASVIKSSIPPI